MMMASPGIRWRQVPVPDSTDLGIPLTFMFIWHMLGALALIPALSHFPLYSVPGSTAKQ